MTASSFQFRKVKKKKKKVTRLNFLKILPCEVVKRGGRENEKDESVCVSIKSSASGKQFALLQTGLGLLDSHY